MIQDKGLRHALRMVVAGILSLSVPAWAGVLPGPVVDAAWLKAHLGEVQVLDVRDDPASWTEGPEFEKDAKTGKPVLSYSGGHLEGAKLVEFGKTRVDREVQGQKISKLLPDAQYVQELMQGVGLIKGKPIVITSPGEEAFEVEEAARLYWTLKVYGEKNVALLDGGNAAWIQAGQPVSTAPFEATRGNWEADALQAALLAETADVEAAAKKGEQVVDARPLPQYLGLFYKKPSIKAGGHVRGARNFPTDVRLRSQGVAQMFLKPVEYEAVLKAQGIDAKAPSITYCNTGHMAAGSWFIQSEILGNGKVRLYDGSMHEWTTLGHPVVGIGG